MIISRLKRYQRRNGLTVEDMSQRLKVSPQMVYYWRDYGIRSWSTAKRVAALLKCQPDDIIGMQDDKV